MATRRPLVLASGVVREMPTGDTVPVTNGGTGVTTSTGTGSVVLSASPALTGTPTAPTAGKADNDTQIATTNFVHQAFVAPSTAGVLDWNDVSNSLPGVGPTLLVGTSATNGPDAVTGINVGWYFMPLNIAYGTGDGTSNTTQFAVHYGNIGRELLVRGRFSGTWGSWTRFLSNANYNEYAPALDGTGAAGTWPIGITGNAATSSSTTGNAATATTLETARTIAISGPVTGTATSFNGSANITIPVTAVNMSDAAISGSLPATKGGTGQTTYVVGDMLYASTTTALSKLAAVAVGNVLRSAGTGTAPAWGKVVMTTDVSGILPAANGGTGQGVYAVGDLLYASTTTAISRLADVAVGNVLRSGGVGVAPAWGKVTLTTDVTGALPAANGGTGNAVYAVGDILYASTTTALSRLADVATGNVLRAGGVGTAPAWGKVALTTDVSGALPVANGGTASTTAANARVALGAVNVAGDIMTGDLSIEKASDAVLTVKSTAGYSALLLSKSGSGWGSYINGRVGTSERWQIILGDASAEGGSNSGSNFAIARFSDAGAVLNEAFKIRRSDGQVDFSANVIAQSYGQFAGTQILGGSQAVASSNYALSGSTYYNNFLTTNVNGSSGVLSYQHVPGVVAQWQFQVNNGGANYTFKNNGHAEAGVAWDVISDERLKRNVTPVVAALDRIDLVDVVTYERMDEVAPIGGPSAPVRHVGVLAQKFRLAQPESVSVSGTEELPDRLVVATDGAGLLALAAVKELKALVLTLRAEIAALKGAA